MRILLVNYQEQMSFMNFIAGFLALNNFDAVNSLQPDGSIRKKQHEQIAQTLIYK